MVARPSMVDRLIKRCSNSMTTETSKLGRSYMLTKEKMNPLATKMMTPKRKTLTRKTTTTMTRLMACPSTRGTTSKCWWNAWPTTPRRECGG